MGSLSRDQLKRLAEAKISDSQFLFENGRWSNAYYLAGYAIEMGLKACIARQIVAEAIPDRSLTNKLFTHRFTELVGLAGLQTELKTQQDQDSIFSANWGIAAEWTPDARYEPTDKATAHYLLNAMGDPAHGVLAWIRTFW